MPENLDLVRSVYEAWGRGDFGSTDWAHPDIEYTYADGINAATRVGLSGMGEGFRDWIGVFSDWTVKADDYIELDEDRVLVLYVSSARPKRSSPETELLRSNGASLFEMHGQLVARIVQYGDRDRAFADLGLEE